MNETLRGRDAPLSDTDPGQTSAGQTSAGQTNADLLDAVQRGDPEAFDVFARRYGRGLLTFGTMMCGHREDAEDVAQETLIRAFQGLAALRDPEAVRTWLYRVAANQCRMQRRKWPPRREVSLAELESAEDAGGGVMALVDDASLPEDEAARAEWRRVLEAALLELPTETRLAIVLRDIQGLSTRETAAALDIGLSAVKMRLHRGREALRQRLDSLR